MKLFVVVYLMILWIFWQFELLSLLSKWFHGVDVPCSLFLETMLCRTIWRMYIVYYDFWELSLGATGACKFHSDIPSFLCIQCQIYKWTLSINAADRGCYWCFSLIFLVRCCVIKLFVSFLITWMVGTLVYAPFYLLPVGQFTPKNWKSYRKWCKTSRN